MKHLIATILMVFVFFSFSNAQQDSQLATDAIKYTLHTTLDKNRNCFIKHLSTNANEINCYYDSFNAYGNGHSISTYIHSNNITNRTSIYLYGTRIDQRYRYIVQTYNISCEIANIKSSNDANCQFIIDNTLFGGTVTIDKSYIKSFINKAKSIAKKAK